MKVRDSVALVTGANRGLGAALAQALLAGGARKVYAAARDPARVTISGVEPIRLDVTRADEIAAAARDCGDVNLLVNNAGISLHNGFVSADALAAARTEMETNYIAPLALSRAFAPVLARHGGGAIVNVLSVLSWLNFPRAATYSASKAAAWSLTNGLRGELRAQGTQVLALHVGYIDTDMARGVRAPKARPEDVARQVLEALEAGRDEVLADEISRQVKLGLSVERGVYLGDQPDGTQGRDRKFGTASAVSQALVGAWKLVSSEFRLSSGEVIHPYGTDAVGLLIYTEDGQMSAQIMRRGRPAFASGDVFHGTPEETNKAIDGLVSYFGSFAVDEAAGTVEHRVVGSAFPNWENATQVRYHELEGSRLTLRTSPLPAGPGITATGVLVWEKTAARQ